MTTIITGNFEQQEDAKEAMSELARAGFAAEDTTRFFVDPPTVEAPPPPHLPNDAPVVDKASIGAASGVAIGGVIGGAIGMIGVVALGPAAPLAGAGVGAYVGSLAGAMAGIEDKNTPETKVGVPEMPPSAPPRKAGTLVAVAAPASAEQDAAIGILQAHGATDIDRSEGTIVDGQWIDFDRSAPLQPV